MEDCSDTEVNNKTRYIRFKPNSISDSSESERRETEEATGGETTADDSAVEQIFLETTVWVRNILKIVERERNHMIACSASLIIKHDPSRDLDSKSPLAITTYRRQNFTNTRELHLNIICAIIMAIST